MGEPRRWFVGAATTSYTPGYRAARGEEDRPELRGEVERMGRLFTGLGYQVVPGFGADVDRDTFRGRLRSFLTDPDPDPGRGEDDVVVVYYTGHGVLDGTELLLPMSDTTADVEFTALPAAELTGRLLKGDAVKVRRMLVILDTCYSGAAMAGIARGVIEFLNRLRVPKTAPSIGLIVAARPKEQAESGAFTRAFVDAVEHRASGGHEPEFLALDGVVGVVNDPTPDWQHARHFLTGDTITQFLPNRRWNEWLRGLDLRTQAQHLVREKRKSELREHVYPRAQAWTPRTRRTCGCSRAGTRRWLPRWDGSPIRPLRQPWSSPATPAPGSPRCWPAWPSWPTLTCATASHTWASRPTRPCHHRDRLPASSTPAG